MKFFQFLIILSSLFFCSCNPKNKSTETQEFTAKEIQDSINNIIIKISDDWQFIESNNEFENTLKLPELEEVNIQYWQKIDTNEPINEFSISGNKFEVIDSINTIEGWIYDDKAIIEYRENHFGLYVTRDSISAFIGIKELNDSLLKMTNGQCFKRIK